MSSPSSNSGPAKESNLLAPNPTPTATSRRGSIPKNTPTWGSEGSEDPASSLRKEMNLVAEAAKRASVAIVVRDLQEFARDAESSGAFLISAIGWNTTDGRDGTGVHITHFGIDGGRTTRNDNSDASDTPAGLESKSDRVFLSEAEASGKL